MPHYFTMKDLNRIRENYERDALGRFRLIKHEIKNVAPSNSTRRISFDAYGNIEGEPQKLHKVLNGKHDIKCLCFYDKDEEVNTPVFGFLVAISFTGAKSPYIIRTGGNVFHCHSIIPFI